ncbi:MAG: hypothetical protein GY749_13365 [Desulfobacteraceae bacterium]|nr:hypothetical protein [Desulfobacteraceae bacterium]
MNTLLKNISVRYALLNLLTLCAIFSPAHSAYFIDSGIDMGTSNSAVLGDFDGDGDLDVFLANNGANKVWFNNGSGIFTDSGQSLGFVNADSLSADAGDIDNDGYLDIFVANYDHSNTVLLNNGAGRFVMSGQVTQNYDSIWVALSDIDNDRDLDAFVVNLEESDRLWLNNGFGHFDFGAQYMGIAHEATCVVLADADGDNDPDVFKANFDGPDKIMINHRGVFTNSNQDIGNSDSRHLAVGDLNGDGHPDIFIAKPSDANEVWLNNGKGIFTDSFQRLGKYSDSYRVALDDIDGDGDLDAFVLNKTRPDAVWMNNGLGYFHLGQELTASSTNHDTGTVLLGDLDGDGDPDAFLANNGQPPNKVWINAGGDTDGNGKIDIGDAILTLKISAGTGTDNTYLYADISGDKKIGLEEAVFILQILGKMK